jgi:2-keto-4-pentenoate hydratase/2-oxohepta-3-ene-1,7-dioic acid hydratase in catechol pathway
MKIFATGMNYRQHNKELDETLYTQEGPVIFTKADSALLRTKKPFFVPEWTARVDCAAGLVVRICRLGKGIPERFAHRYYDAVTVGIDFTAGDCLERAAERGLPWEISKGFDGSAAVGEWSTLPEYDGKRRHLRFRLDKNGETVQSGDTSDMVYTADKLIAYISQFFTLRTGDLLYTGYPAVMGPVQIGDHLEGWLEDQKVLDIRCK